jgi:Tetratricopeptide repeat
MTEPRACSSGWILLSAFFLLFLSGCTSDPIPEKSGASQEYRNWGPEARYVGKEVCGSCHLPNYEAYVRGQMGRSWKKALLSNSAADFNNPDPIYSEEDDLFYQPFNRGEDLFVMEYRLADGDTVHKRVEQIDYIAGSGQHTNSHIFEENGYLNQIPVTWYVQEGHWGLAPKFQHGNNYRFNRAITDECMSCHNAISDFDESSENRFTYVPEGIDCERCHGPGSVHVDEINAGRVVDVTKEIDYSIVNPAKLSPQGQLDVCKRCHMQGAAVFADGQAPLDYLPGKALNEFENVYWTRQPDSVQGFIMASHPDRLAMSQCFLKTWEPASDLEPLTCLSCHNPHLPIEDVEENFIPSVCQSCHQEEDQLTCTEPTVVAGTATGTCVSCHMPTSGATDIPYVRVTDHFIRVPGREEARLSKLEADRRTTFVRLASLVEKNPDSHQLADGYMAFYEKITNRPGMLDSAAVELERARKANPDEEMSKSWIRLWHLQEDYAAIRRYVRSRDIPALNDAWTFSRVGEAFAATGEFQSAILYFRRAVNLKPRFLRFKDRLASTYTNMGDYATAISLFDEILAENSNFDRSINNRGFVLLLDGKFEDAELDFKAALALNPDAELPLANLASLYYNTGKPDSARPLVRRLLKISPQNSDYARLWSLLSP